METPLRSDPAGLSLQVQPTGNEDTLSVRVHGWLACADANVLLR